MSPYKIIEPKNSEVPILVSVPHCGIAFPDELKSEYKNDLINAPDDTDWFVDQLYDFAPSMGITMITATYSRWVVDLNRDPESKPLYTDGRIITALCPATDFLGNPIYGDERKEVSLKNQQERVEKYYRPYHNQIQSNISALKKKFGKVLLWDCHSIRQTVKTIRPQPFPDLILGDADETSASKEIIQTALQQLGNSGYSIQHNDPFKGGYITRHYGKPLVNQHALQLEMTKVNYMHNGETSYDKVRAEKIREVLKRTFDHLIQHLM